MDSIRRPLESAVAPARRRRRLILSLWLVFLFVVAGVVVAAQQWLRLRYGLEEMRSALVDAREQQQTMRLRLATAEVRLREELDLLGLDAGVKEGPAPVGAAPRTGPSVDGRMHSTDAGSSWGFALGSRLADSAAELEAGGDVQGVATGLRQLAVELRAADAGASRQRGLLADELDGLAAALAASTRVDWPGLRARLDALVQAANRLPPTRVALLGDRPGGESGWSRASKQHELGPRSRDRSNRFRQALRAQLEVAESAIQLRDLALLRLSGAAIEHLLQAHYPAASTDALALARQLTALRRAVKAMDRDAVAARIQNLAEVLVQTKTDQAPAAVPSPER
jgi:uncharacterized protein HemX